MPNRRAAHVDPWADSDDEESREPFKPLSAQEARELAARNPSVSPWRVIAVQAAVGLVMAALGWLLTGRQGFAWSALYGAATVVMPGALLARGMTSRNSSLAPGVSAVSFMMWEFAKIGCSVAMLLLAPSVVPQLSWPALLAGLAGSISVYWFALAWRVRRKS
jgi:ATP synthase protein I